jgi:four helix bundle protein
LKFNRFEEILAWQKAKEISLLIYTTFSNCRDYSFRDQIQRASISVMNNIAEGFERSSNKEFKHFLFIAKGSSAEIRSMIVIASELRYVNKETELKIYNLSEEISKMLSGLIKTL